MGMGALQHPLGGSALEAIIVAGPAEAVAGGLSEATEARLAARAAADRRPLRRGGGEGTRPD